jgi:hypothetical protein
MSEYLALRDGARRFRQDFSGPVLLRDPAGPVVLRLQGFHLLWRCFPDSFVFDFWSRAARRRNAGPTTPARPRPYRFGLLPVRSPLLRESLLFSLPPGT